MTGAVDQNLNTASKTCQVVSDRGSIMGKKQNASTKIPKYAVVYWTHYNSWSIVLSEDVPNKRMLHDPKILDDIPYKVGPQPATGWELHCGVVLRLGSKNLVYDYCYFI